MGPPIFNQVVQMMFATLMLAAFLSLIVFWQTLTVKLTASLLKNQLATTPPALRSQSEGPSEPIKHICLRRPLPSTRYT